MNAGQLFRLSRALRDIAIAAAGDSGERPRLSLVLITDDIAQHDDTTVGDVAARTGLTQSAVSQAVARLRQAGVVRAVPDPEDGRRTRIGIDPKARADIFAPRAGRGIQDALAEQLPELDARQRKRVERLLHDLASAMDLGPAR